jgi:hypothetical protein
MATMNDSIESPRGFVELHSDPLVLGLYDPENGVVHLMSDALGNRTLGVNSLEEANARYVDYVEETRLLEEIEE